MDESELRQLGETVFLIRLSSEQVIDEVALVRALGETLTVSVCLDVFDGELVFYPKFVSTGA